MAQENPNFNIGSEEELRGRLEALRHRAIEQKANFQDNRNFVFQVFTFQNSIDESARIVAHLRASLFSRDVSGKVFEGEERNAFIVDVGVMTDSQYEQYQSERDERDRRLSDLETSIEDQELRRLKSQAGNAVSSFTFNFNLYRDLPPEETVKSVEEMLREFKDVATQAGYEELGANF